MHIYIDIISVLFGIKMKSGFFYWILLRRFVCWSVNTLVAPVIGWLFALNSFTIGIGAAPNLILCIKFSAWVNIKLCILSKLNSLKILLVCPYVYKPVVLSFLYNLVKVIVLTALFCETKIEDSEFFDPKPHTDEQYIMWDCIKL